MSKRRVWRAYEGLRGEALVRGMTVAVPMPDPVPPRVAPPPAPPRVIRRRRRPWHIRWMVQEKFRNAMRALHG